MSFNKKNKRKTSMLLYQLEESLGNYILNHNPTIDNLPKKTVNNILERNEYKKINKNKIEELLEATYLDEVFHFALELTKNTSIHRYIEELMYMFKLYDIFYIRNIVAHPNKQFLDEYWYKVALIASSRTVEIIGLNDVKHALLSAESGTINDPPEEWLEEITHILIPNNLLKKLEHSITGLIGRTSEEKELLKLLKNLRIPTIAIVAQGGIGKTALVHDLLNKIILEPETSSWNDGIVFIDMKTEKLTSKGIQKLEAIETIEELENNIVSNINLVFNDSCNNLDEIFEKYKEKKLLLFIDNLETLLRDNANSFETFNYSLPREWRVLVTSRVSITSASIITLDTLNTKSAIQLAKVYTSKKGQRILKDDEYNNIVISCHKNPLAIRLTLDLYISGYELPLSIDKSTKMIAGFSFNNLIEKLSENAVKILEALFIDKNIDRVRLCELLNLSLDEVAETIYELSKTSLITRNSEKGIELFNLSSSIRELLLISPRNIKIRNNIKEQLKRVKELSIEIERKQGINKLNELSLKFIPYDTNKTLKILIDRLNSSFEGKKINMDIAKELYKEFINYIDIFENEYMYHKSIGRLYNALGDTDNALNSFQKAIDLNENDYIAKYLLANTYFHNKQDYEKSESIYHTIIGTEVIAQERWFAKSVFNGYFLSCLYQHKYETVLAKTKNWKDGNSFITGILGTYRASAWRRKLETIGHENIVEYSEALLKSANSFNELFCEVGYIDIACRQALKLIEDIEYNIDNEKYTYDDRLELLKFIESHIINISNNFQDIEKNYVTSLLMKLSKIDLKNNMFKNEEWINIMKPNFSNTISEDYAIKNGFKIVYVKNIPKNNFNSFSNFIFADDNDKDTFFIHKSTLISQNLSDWELLQVGKSLAIKADEKSEGSPSASETYIIE